MSAVRAISNYRRLVATLALSAALPACSGELGGENIASTGQTVTNGTVYEFKPQHSGKCMDVSSNGTHDGANIQQWSCNGTTAQKFKTVSTVSGYYKLVVQNGSNKCVDVSGSGTGDGVNIQLWTCNGTAAQDFRFEASNGHYRIVNRNSNKCIDVAWASQDNGANIAQVSCNGNSAQTFATVVAGGGGGGTNDRIVSYIPSWNSSTYIPYSKLTHINVAFAVPNSTGGLAWPENGSWIQNTVVPNAHSNGVKVLVAVGGWMADSPGAGTFDSAIKYHRSTLVNNIMSIVNTWNLDGVDIDYEYPGSDVASEFPAFISDLRNALGTRLLTAAVAAKGVNADGVPSSTFGNFNFINLMAYDNEAYNHSSYSFAQESLNYWTGRGLPASKAVLGVPFYGRGHSSWGSTITYASLVAQNSANACQDSNGTYGYNGIKTIRSKGSLARSYGGAMYWEQSQDSTGANSLTTALREAVNGQAGSYYCP